MKRQSFIVFLLMLMLYFGIAFVTGLNNPFSKVIQTQFSLSTAQSQFGSLAFFLAYLFMGVPSSLLVERFNYKRTTQISLLLIIASLAVVLIGGNSGYIWLYLFGMFLLGSAITILQVVVNPVIVAVGSEKGANARMNIGGTMSSLGATLAPLLVGFIIGNAAVGSLSVHDVNPLLYCVIGIVSLMFAVVCLVPFPELGISHSSESKLDFNALLRPGFLLGVVAIFLYVGFETSTANITNLFMINGLGVDAATAGAVVGVYWLLMLVGRAVGSAVGTKVGSRTQLIAVSAAALLLYLAAILIPLSFTVAVPAVDSHFNFVSAELPLSVLLLVLCGLCASVMWTCIFILATRGLGADTNLASGVFMMMVMGGGVVPSLQGHIVDMTGSFSLSYVVGLVCLAFILFYALVVVRFNKN